MILYEADIIETGSMVADEVEEGYLVTFSEGPFNDFKEYYMSLKMLKDEAQKVKCGDSLILGSESFEIKAIGKLAMENLSKLGHITVRFLEKADVLNMGDISVTGSLKNLDIKKFIITRV